MQIDSSEYHRVCTERDRYRQMLREAELHIVSLDRRLQQELEITDQYRAWFTNHEYVTTPRPEPITDKSTMYAPVIPS